MQDVKTFRQAELVLGVNRVYDTGKLDLRAWKPFLDRLCGDRVYQKEAIEAAVIYLASGQYQTLRDLAVYNYSVNLRLQDKYPAQKDFFGCFADAGQAVRQYRSCHRDRKILCDLRDCADCPWTGPCKACTGFVPIFAH